MALLRIGADPFPPYQYYDEEGRIQGSDYKKVLSVFSMAGHQVDVLIDNWKLIEEKLLHKELDAAFQVQMTPKRVERFFLSDLFRNAVTQVITGDEMLRVSNFQELLHSEVSVGVIENYAYGDPLDQLRPENKESFGSQEELLQAISSGDVKIGVFDKGVKEYLVSKLELTGIYSLDNLEFVRPLYVMFNNRQLRDDFNLALKSSELSR